MTRRLRLEGRAESPGNSQSKGGMHSRMPPFCFDRSDLPSEPYRQPGPDARGALYPSSTASE